MAQVIETVFSIRTEESVANLNEVVGALGRTEQAAKKAAKSASDEMAKIPASTKKAKAEFNGLANSINQVSRELPAFAFSAQTGFLAISNNLPILADEITALRKANEALAAQGKATIPVWKQVASSLLSWQTALSLGVSLLVIYGKELGNFFGSLFKGKEAFSAFRVEFNAINETYKDKSLSAAITNIKLLSASTEEAGKTLNGQKWFVEEYNKTIGAVTGSVKTFKEAEQGIIDGTDAYIKAITARITVEKLAGQYSDLSVQQEFLKVENERELQAERNRLLILYTKGQAVSLKTQEQYQKETGKINTNLRKEGEREQDYVLRRVQTGVNKKATLLNKEVQDLQKQKEVIDKIMAKYVPVAGGTLIDDTGKGATEILKTEFEKLKIQIAELQTQIENGIYKDKNVAKDIALLAKLEQKVKDVEKAFSVLTGEDAELNFQAAIKDSEDFLTEVGKQSADDLKDRRKEDKKAIEDKLTANKEYYLRRKEQAGDNQKQLDIENENEILGDIKVYKAAIAAGEDYGDKLLAAEEKLRLLRLGIANKGAKEREDIENQLAQKSLEMAAGLASKFFDLQSNQLKAESDLEIKNLEEMRDKKIITEEQFKTKSADIKNQAAKQQREYDLAQIQVNTALAIIKALATAPTILAGIPLAALAGIEGAIQYAFAAAQPLPQFAKGTPRVTGGIAGQDSVHALLMPNEAVIPAKANMERQGLAKAWISGDLDKHLAMNYINPAINEVNRKWETSLKLNQQSTFIRNDSFNDKKIVGELVKSNKLNRALVNSLSEGKTVRRNKRIWN